MDQEVKDDELIEVFRITAYVAKDRRIVKFAINELMSTTPELARLAIVEGLMVVAGKLRSGDSPKFDPMVIKVDHLLDETGH